MVFLPVAIEAQTPAAKDAEAAREQSIYIPYKKLREVFEKEGRVVFMPYEKFLELWRERLEKMPTPPAARLPVDALITEITNTATVSRDVVTVASVLKIEVLKEGWNEVCLRLGDAAISRALVDQKPARITFDKAVGYKLLVEKKGKDPHTFALDLEFRKSYTKAPGQNNVSFETPMAPVSRWEVRIPEPGVKVNIQPLLAATEIPVAEGAKESVVLAFVGAAPTVQIDWTPKAEGARGLTALVSVKAEQELSIEEGVTRTRVVLAYAVSRAALASLTVEVPADQKVVNVFDPNVREWSVEPAGAVQKITVQLFEPVRTSQNLTIELQKFAPEDSRSASVPLVSAVGVTRQQGVVVVRAAEGLRAEPSKRMGLLQVDASELPPGLARTRWMYSYRYASLPFELTLDVEKIEPHIEAETLVEAHLQVEELSLDVSTVYDIQKAGVFRLELDIPQGYEVRSVGGWAVAGGAPARVDTHHLEGPDNTHLVVNLSQKAMGRAGLAVGLTKKLREPDLMSPTGKTVSIPLGLARVTPAMVKRQGGRVVVYAPESLRVNPGETKGLRSIPFGEATAAMRSTLRSGVERPVLAFAFTDEPASLTLTAERRKPQVTAAQLMSVRMDTGVVKYNATLYYDIAYSGVKSLRLDVPAALASEIRLTTPGIRYQVLEDAERPADLVEGYVAWRLSGETEFMGARHINLTWEKKTEKLDVGKSVEIDIPRLRPMNVDRAWGQIVLAKSETIDVRPAKASESLRPIDPQQDLMRGVIVAAAARAFEFHEDWQLTVAATRYELQEVKQTSIERALVRMVVTRSNVTSVQTIYQIHSSMQRLHVTLPENVSYDTEPLRINGRPVTLEQGGEKKNIVSVPLVGQSPDTPFLLELRYTVTGAGTLLACPVFRAAAPGDESTAAAEPAVQKVRLSVYLPQEWVYLGSIGPWTPELFWYRMGLMRRRPASTVDAKSLIRWVSEGVGIDTGFVENFETDGYHYLFSTLCPSPPPKGSLRVVAVRRVWLSVFVLIIIVGGGLALVRQGWQRRCLAVGAFIVGMVLLGVFLPTFTRQIVNLTMVGSVVIVLVAWGLWYLLVTRPRGSGQAAPAPSRVWAFLKGLPAKLRRRP
jgi:hypothetical protein